MIMSLISANLHAESRRLRLRRARDAGAAAGVAGHLLAAAPDPAAAQAGALPGNPPADRARAQRADADEDAVVAAAAAHAAGGNADPRRRAAAAQPPGRPAGQGPPAAGDRRRLGVGAGLDDAHRPRRAPDPARRARRSPGGPDRHGAATARCTRDAARRAQAGRGAHDPARLPPQAVADRPRPGCGRHRQTATGRWRLCGVAERRAAGWRHRQAHRSPAPLQRPRSRAPRPGYDAAGAAAARRRRPRSQGPGASPGGRRAAQDGGPGVRRPGQGRGPHRARVRRQRAPGRRRAARAARAAQPHDAARHRDPGRRRQRRAARRTQPPPSGLGAGRARDRGRTAASAGGLLPCRRRSTPMSACRSAIARRC